MSERKPTAFPILMKNDICSLIQAADDVYQIRFSNRAANAYLVRGSARTILIDVGLSSNYPAMVECLNFVGCPPEKIDMVVLSHEHLDHIGAAWHFNERRTYVAAHRLAANKIMLRDDFSMLRKMFNEPNVPINIDIWLEEGNLIDLGNFRLNVMYTPGHTSACITLFEQDKGLLVRRRHPDAGRRHGRRVRLRQHRRLHPVAGAHQGAEHEDPAVRARKAVGHAAGRRAHCHCALAQPAGRHCAIVRRAGCALELRADHAVGAGSEQAG